MNSTLEKSGHSKPLIILATGAWHLPECWDTVKGRLEAVGHDVLAPRLPTVCGPEAVNHTVTHDKPWRADVATVLDLVTPLFDTRRTALLVGHLYSGVVTTNTVPGHSVAERAARGRRGGFIGAVYVCAFPVLDPGPRWFRRRRRFLVHHGICLPNPGKDALPAAEVQKWIAKLQHQSQQATEEPSDWCSNDLRDLDRPLTYLVCENVQVLPLHFQERFVEHIPNMKVMRCDSGCSPFLGQPDTITKVIV
ncbi:Alpha/beta hydrolase fold-1 [Xylariaceae sp. FL1651]|nr:Alpha/beta hydrolase fold-1 [Xylariaceae sp. FL1651]